MSILIIAEHDNQHLKTSTLHTIAAALKLSESLQVLVVGYQCQQVALQAAKISSVQKVLVTDAECFQHQLPENFAPLIKEIAGNFSHILVPATAFGKNLLPRAAALLDVGQISDVTEIISADTFVRPIYAGNAVATVQSLDSIKLISIRATAFAAAEVSGNSAPIEALSLQIQNNQSKWLSLEATPSERPDLADAKIVISGGRGLQSAENFQLLNRIADHLGAAIGATRAAVDAGFAPNDYQVGQTGKVVAPQLYIAVGISGAIQHMAGMKDSKVIVAINKDPDAPIFQIADYGLVGDLFEILPELERALGIEEKVVA